VLGLLIVVGVSPHELEYFPQCDLRALLVALSDPGGKYGPRLAMAAMAGAALLTALGFGIGGGPWGSWVLALLLPALAVSR
jgi:hypothetical protein